MAAGAVRDGGGADGDFAAGGGAGVRDGPNGADVDDFALSPKVKSGFGAGLAAGAVVGPRENTGAGAGEAGPVGFGGMKENVGVEGADADSAAGFSKEKIGLDEPGAAVADKDGGFDVEAGAAEAVANENGFDAAGGGALGVVTGAFAPLDPAKKVGATCPAAFVAEVAASGRNGPTSAPLGADAAGLAIGRATPLVKYTPACPFTMSTNEMFCRFSVIAFHRRVNGASTLSAMSSAHPLRSTSTHH